MQEYSRVGCTQTAILPRAFSTIYSIIFINLRMNIPALRDCANGTLKSIMLAWRNLSNKQQRLLNTVLLQSKTLFLSDKRNWMEIWNDFLHDTVLLDTIAPDQSHKEIADGVVSHTKHLQATHNQNKYHIFSDVLLNCCWWKIMAIFPILMVACCLDWGVARYDLR